mmetsp:Transcript_10359/g.20401  ORF Transcript_10359/g.20401 Transcript_10359/m.20401 type:complete len:636 (+) Transcript_10359:291-2198(+)
MKRALTSEIMMAFSPSPLGRRPSGTRPASPASTVYNSPIQNEKRRRVVSYDGQTQAIDSLLSGTAPTNAPAVSWDSKEFFSMLRVPEANQAKIQRHVEALRDKLAMSGMTHAERRRVAQSAVKAIWAMTSTMDKIKSREKQPEKANTAQAEVDLQDASLKPMQSISLHSKVCKDCIQALTSVHECREAIAGMVRDCENEVNLLKGDADRLIVVARAEEKDRESALNDAGEALTRHDSRIVEFIKKTNRNRQINTSNSITLCLDAVLDPTPELAPVLTERRKLRQALSQATSCRQHSQKSVRVYEHLVNVILTARASLMDEIRSALEAATAHRSHVSRVSMQTILKQIPSLAKSLSDFITFQHERNEAAARSMVKKREELADHLRLYGDEAPSELKEIKRRIAEFEGIKARSSDNLKKIAEDQKQLWLLGLARAPQAPQKSDSGDEPAQESGPRQAVLPSSVIIRLQRCLLELEETLRNQQGVEDILSAVREILAQSYEFCPRHGPAAVIEVDQSPEKIAPTVSAAPEATPRTRGVAMVHVPHQGGTQYRGGSVPPLYLENIPDSPMADIQSQDVSASTFEFDTVSQQTNFTSLMAQSQSEEARSSFLDQVTVAAGFADEDDEELEDSSKGGCILQ